MGRQGDMGIKGNSREQKFEKQLCISGILVTIHTSYSSMATDTSILDVDYSKSVEDTYLRFAMPADEFFYDFMWLCSQTMIRSESLVPEEFREWYDRTKYLLIRGCSFENVLHDSNQAVGIGSSSITPNRDEYIVDRFFGRFFDAVVRMSLRLMVTCDGRIGLVSEHAKKGDLVVILFGCSVPVLLRQSGDDGEDTFFLVGECFLDGFMDGKGLGSDDFPERDFLIE